jgi:DNA-binding response OmpR family regulator
MIRKDKTTVEAPGILLVEPDAFLADIYEKNLMLEDFRVTKAVSGERALTLLKTKRFDLVLLSATLPKMNGFETLEAIKKNPKTAGIPVVLLSKLGTREDVDKSLVLGAAGYIIKTHFQPSEVVDKIKQILFHKH